MTERETGAGSEPVEGDYGRAREGSGGYASTPEGGEPGSTSGYAAEEAAGAREEARPARARRERAPNMLPGRNQRRFGLERALVRVVATGGVIGISVAIAAILGSSNVQAWIIGLVVSALSVLLSAVLWSSRQL